VTAAALSVREMSKSYNLWGRRSQFQTLKSALLGRELPPSAETSVVALRDISFEVARGESFGVIGRNGSGKSTLLKLVSGILKPTTGSIEVAGRISALIELGAGFHPEISGRENIFINGIMLGLTKREIEQRFSRIVEFAGIGDYLDQPVKTYSSGMYVRLGFSVAVHVDPDILLIDEVLAVGDEEFSQKCIAKLQELKFKGVTLLFVTHQLDHVRTLCDRALWLDDGEIAAIGDPVRVVDRYLQAVSGSEILEKTEPESPIVEERDEEPDSDIDNDLLEEERWGTGEVLLDRVLLVDAQGEQLIAVGSGTSITILMDVQVRKPQTDFVFGIGFYHADGTCVYGTNTDLEGLLSEELNGEARVKFIVPSLDLVGGAYRIDAAVHTRNGRAFDYRRGVLRFTVGSRVHDIGVYRPKHEWAFEGEVQLKRIDDPNRNLPAAMADYIKESETDADPSKYRKRRRRKKEPAKDSS